MLALLCSLAGAACDAPPATPLPDGDELPPTDDLPLLPGGNHAGMIVGFNSEVPIATAAAIDARWREAVAAGMKIGRVQLDWADVETAPGRYDLAEIEAQLAVLSRDHLRPFVLIDSFDGEIPSDLRAEITQGRMGWDSPTMMARHAEMLRQVMPTLSRHGIWMLSIANEVGNILDDVEPARRAELTRQLVAFFSSSRDKAHELAPGLAIAVTVREQQFEAGDTEAAFVALSDVASFNFYCSRFNDGLRVVSEPAQVRPLLDGMLARAGAKSIVLQELGCHAGFASRPSPTSATAEQQARFYDVVFTEIAARPRMRAAIVFQLVDWSASLVETEYSIPFRAEGLPESFIAQYAETLETAGMLRFSDGVARPAWATFVSHL